MLCIEHVATVDRPSGLVLSPHFVIFIYYYYYYYLPLVGHGHHWLWVRSTLLLIIFYYFIYYFMFCIHRLDIFCLYATIVAFIICAHIGALCCGLGLAYLLHACCHFVAYVLDEMPALLLLFTWGLLLLFLFYYFYICYPVGADHPVHVFM